MSDSPKLAALVAEPNADLIAAFMLRFDRDWDEGQIDTFVTELTAWPPEVRGQALVQLVKIDIERRWQSGHNTEVEQYLSRFPDLGTANSVSPELLLAEWEVRQQCGEQPRYGEFARRFPRQVAALQQLLRQAENRESPRRQAAPDESSQHDTSKIMSQHVLSKVERNPAVPASPSLTAPHFDEVDLSEKFGRYRIVRKLGGGGMGTVYLADDLQLDRQVALKVPHFNSQTSAEILERFEREAKTAAKLSHANICQLFDVGEIDGRHFLTMEYIDGRPLSKLVGTKSLTDKLAIQLVRQVAIAVGAAHKQNIIHRDLKPANIMLTSDGKPKVTDFGLARRLGANDQRMTQSGMIIGTPAYMPLEQLNGDLDEVGPHSDVYSLGVILYELLTGHLPFEVSSDAPVTVLFAKILTASPDPPTKYRPDLDTRLETIVLKAIAKQHTDRYRTMAEFADALSEYLKSYTTIAAPALVPPDSPVFPLFNDRDTDSAPVRSRQRRKKSPSLKTTVRISTNSLRTRWNKLPFPAQVVCLCLGFAFLLGVTLWFRSGDALVKIEVHADDVEVTFQKETITLADGTRQYQVKPGEHTLHIKSGNAEFDTNKFTLKKGDNPAITVELVKSEIVSQLGKQQIGRHRLSKASPQPSPQNVKPTPNPDWDPANVRDLVTLTGHTGPVSSVAISPDGKRLASVSRDGTMKVWDATSGQETLTLKAHTGAVYCVAFSPDGKWLASGSADQTVKVWDATNGQETLTFKGHSDVVHSVTFSPDGKRLASAGIDQTVKVWDATSGQETLTLNGHTGQVMSVAFSPDGKWVASASRDGTMKVWDATSGQETLTFKGHTGTVKSVAFSPDGKRLATASNDQTVKVWDATSGQTTLTLKGHTRYVQSVAFSSDGKWLVSASSDQTVKVWDATSGQETLTLNGHTSHVLSVAFFPNEKRLASASEDKSVRVWGTGRDVAAADRRAAEWVLSIGGRVGLLVEGVRRDVKSIQELPQQAFQVVHVDLRGNDKVDDDGLQALSGLTMLSNPNLNSTRITDRGLAILAEISSIEHLAVGSTRITDEGLALLQKLPHLKNVRLTGTAITDAGLAHVASLKGLIALQVEATQVTVAGVRKLTAALPQCIIGSDHGTFEPTTLSSAAVQKMQATLQKAFAAKVTVQSSGLVEFAYDFSDPRQLDDWLMREPQSEWAVEAGWLASKKLASKNASDTRLFHRALFAGRRREIHYDAQGKYDLNGILFADLINFHEGYRTSVAGEGDGGEHVGFHYSPKSGGVYSSDVQKLGFTRVGPLDPTKTYRVNAVTEGGNLSLAFNGEVLRQPV